MEEPKLEPAMETGFEDNPWYVDTLDHFLYYVCPECAHQTNSKYDFVQHALERHPKADGAIPIQELEEDAAAAEAAAVVPAAGYEDEMYAAAGAGGGGGGQQDYAAAAAADYANYKKVTAGGVAPPPPPPAAKKRRPSGGKKPPGGGAGRKGPPPQVPPAKRPKLDTSSDDGPSLAGIDFPRMEDGKYACPWPGCGQILSNIGNTKRHYKQTHMEQQPQACKVCHMELRNQAACDAHMKATHNITNREIKMARFIPMSEDGQMGLYALENGKTLCTSCSVAFSNIGNGKRHFNQVHLGIKGPGDAAASAGQSPAMPPVKQETYPYDGIYQQQMPSTSQQVTPIKKPPKPKSASGTKKPPSGQGTPKKIKSETLPLLISHDMGASPMKAGATGASPMKAFDDTGDDGMAGITFPKGDDGRWPCPWPGCTQSLSALSSARRHYKQSHMEQQPQACKVCHNEFKNQAACDNHMKQVHNITNKELKMAKFEPMSEDGLHGLYALENGKSLCSVCSTALSTVGSGKRHYKNVHMGIKQGAEGGAASASGGSAMDEAFEELAMKLEY